MMRLFSAVTLCSLLVFCNPKQQQEESKPLEQDTVQTTSNEAPAFTVKGAQLSEYQKFLNSLDVADVTMVSEARDRFQGLFYDQDEATRDSAYFLFENFYWRVSDAINNLHYTDTMNYEPLLMVQDNPGIVLSQELIEYRDKLRDNGFQVSMSEGSTYVQQDRDYMKKFYKQLSQVMVSYLEQRNKENSEGFWEDGGLVIEPVALIDRIAWWEEFNGSNPQFIFQETSRDLQRIYTTTLITGEDNTPLFYEDELSEYYTHAYEYLLKKYPDSKTATQLRPYYSNLQKADTAAMRKFREEYLK